MKNIIILIHFLFDLKKSSWFFSGLLYINTFNGMEINLLS